MKAETEKAKEKQKDMAKDGMNGTMEKDGEKSKGTAKAYSLYMTITKKMTIHQEERMMKRKKITKKAG